MLKTNAEPLATTMLALRLDFTNGLRCCLLAAAGESNAKAAAAPPPTSLLADSPAALHPAGCWAALSGCATSEGVPCQTQQQVRGRHSHVPQSPRPNDMTMHHKTAHLLWCAGPAQPLEGAGRRSMRGSTGFCLVCTRSSRQCNSQFCHHCAVSQSGCRSATCA